MLGGEGPPGYKVVQNRSRQDKGKDATTLMPYVTVSTGSSYYDNVRPLAYPDSDAVLICFDISRPETLDSVIKKVSALFFSSFQPFGSEFNICCAAGRGKKKVSFSLSIRSDFSAGSLHCHASTTERMSAGVRAALSFISSKRPWILDPPAPLKNGRSGCSRTSSRGISDTQIIHIIHIKEFVAELELPLSRRLKFNSGVLCRTVGQIKAVRWPVARLKLWGCGHGRV